MSLDCPLVHSCTFVCATCFEAKIPAAPMVAHRRCGEAMVDDDY